MVRQLVRNKDSNLAALIASQTLYFFNITLMVWEWIFPAQTPSRTRGCEGGSDRPWELLSSMRGQGDLGFLVFSPVLLSPVQGA